MSIVKCEGLREKRHHRGRLLMEPKKRPGMQRCAAGNAICPAAPISTVDVGKPHHAARCWSVCSREPHTLPRQLPTTAVGMRRDELLLLRPPHKSSFESRFFATQNSWPR